ncbi:MAG: DinB family protein, partial [Chloroflexota bacterium]|nr:DinB family protein [Chloroflexota bacterium]
MSEPQSLSLALVRQLHLVLRELDGLDDETVNRALPFAPANTLFQLGTHIAGSARWWTITNTGGSDFHRNRAAEFTAVGTAAELRADLERLTAQIEVHLAALDPDALEEPLTNSNASMSHWPADRAMTQRDAI